MRTFRILAALVMAVVCVGLSSCSKDDDKKESDNTLSLLMGTWEREGTWKIWTDVVREGTSLTTYIFKSDKTYTLIECDYKIDNGKDRIDTEEGTFTYYEDTKKLVLNDGEDKYTVTIIEITNNTLTIDDDGGVEIYTRKNK